jgi:hypothetical protein
MNPIERIGEIQIEFSRQDHDLLLALSQKSDKELEEYLNKMIEQLEGIRRQKNPNWTKQQENLVRTTQLMMEYRELKRIMKDESDDVGGTSLS